MKKKLLILGSFLFLLSGCGKIPTLTNGEEAVVTFKDDIKISVDDFYQEIKDSFGLQTLVSMVDKYIFETEFADKTNDAKAYSEAIIKQFKENYDDENTALQVLQNYYNYATFDAYQNAAYISYLQNEGIILYAQDQITDKELEDYYENNVYPDMNISHILITPDVTDNATDEEKSAAESKAKEKLLNIIKELDQAKKDGKDVAIEFSNLAKEYSEDASTKNNGGSLGVINIGELDSTYDELIKAASKLKDGEYSSKTITTELGYHIILKTETLEKASYEDSIDSMKEKIATEKISNNSKIAIEAIKYYRQKYDLNIIDSELKTQYSKFMNNLINSNS